MSYKFEQFERADVVYKTLNGVPFHAAVLVPKSSIGSHTQAHPLLVHFHGGGLVMGAALDPGMLPHWYVTPSTLIMLLQFG
jgi:cephalosporin-C deacetylase-like acetyl esterase